MKKLRLLVIMSLLLVIGGQAMAQVHGVLFLGASVPMKDYADFNGVDNFALVSNGGNAAAAIGFNGGIKWYFNVGVKGLDVLLSIDGIYNNINADAKAFYKDRQEVLDLLGNKVELTTPKYVNVPAMLGLSYIYHLNPNFGFYVEAGAGGNARFITNYTEAYTDLLNIKHKSTVNYETKFGFAYQAGLGIEVAKSLLIGCSFYNLGKTEVTAEKVGDVLSTPLPLDGSSIRPIMVLGRIGLSF